MGSASAAGVGGVLAGPWGAAAGLIDTGMKGAANGNMGIPQQSINPQLTAMQASQAQNATNFRNELPSLKSQGQAQIQNNAGVSLNNQLKTNSRSASSRGLLYSGMKQQADSTAGAQAATQVANDTATLNSGLNSQANQLDTQALQNAVQLGNLNSQQNWNAYQMALAQKQAQTATGDAVMGGLGGILGSFGGAGAAAL